MATLYDVFGDFGHFSNQIYLLKMTPWQKCDGTLLDQEFDLAFENLIGFELALQ